MLGGRRDELEDVRFVDSTCHVEFRVSLNGSFGKGEWHDLACGLGDRVRITCLEQQSYQVGDYYGNSDSIMKD